MDFGYFFGNSGCQGRIHPEALIAHERFTAQLEQQSLESRLLLRITFLHASSCTAKFPRGLICEAYPIPSELIHPVYSG
jgi:hypothetical protein